MEPSEESLSSVWEGSSLSRMNDPTEWRCTCLSFREVSAAPDDSANRKVFEILGRGTSLWRNLSIEFTIAGHYDTYTNKFQLRKRHQGKYTNEVVYAGSIQTVRDAQTNTLVFCITGSYHNGYIELRQKPGGVGNLLRQVVSGYTWSGSSVSRTNDKTDWTDVTLDFHPPFSAREALDEECGGEESVGVLMSRCEITGTGVSLWRDIEIEFDLRGALNLQTLEIELEKEHKGPYTNIVHYSGVLDPDHFCITGQYSNGTIELTCNGELDDDGRWSGEDWRLLSCRLLRNASGVMPKYTSWATSMEQGGFEQISLEEVGSGGDYAMYDEDDDEEGKAEYNYETSLDHLLYRQPRDDESKGMDHNELAQAQANARPTSEEEICKICYENNISCVFVPCGHFCACLSCGMQLDSCCICRVKVDIAQKVFRA